MTQYRIWLDVCYLVPRRGAMRPAPGSLAPSLSLVVFLVSHNALGVTGNCKTCIRNDGVNQISRVAYQNHQVYRCLALADEGHRSCAIRIHIVSSRSGTQDQGDVAIHGYRVHLHEVAVTIKSCLCDAINYERSVWCKNLSVNNESVSSFDGDIRTFVGMSADRRRQGQSHSQQEQRNTKFHGASKFYGWHS